MAQTRAVSPRAWRLGLATSDVPGDVTKLVSSEVSVASTAFFVVALATVLAPGTGDGTGHHGMVGWEVWAWRFLVDWERGFLGSILMFLGGVG